MLDDVRKDFDFESLLSAITSDVVVERKYKDPITIPFEEGPKFVITTNYTINGNGNSYDRRKHEIEFSNYYHKGLAPDMEFGHRLFDDWTEEQWDDFFITMIYYLQYYLKNGLQTYTAKNLPVRKIINSTCQDFYDFMENEINLDSEYNKAELHQAFKLKYPDYDKLTSNRFTLWISTYVEIMNYKLTQRQSNGHRYFTISDPNKLESADEGYYVPVTDLSQIF